MEESKIYVGDLNFVDKVTSEEQFAQKIDLVEVTLREEVVYDAELSVAEKAILAKALDDLGIPIIQFHARGIKEVIRACRDAGVKAKLDVICRPYHPYGYADWKEEIRAIVEAGADVVHPSITTPRKWTMGDTSMSVKGITQRAFDATAFAMDIGAREVTVSFTDAPRTDFGYLSETGAGVVERGASTLALQDTVGVAKPSSIRYLVQAMKKATGARIEVHCHNDFGLGSANTLAALAAGAEVADVAVNGADPVRAGLASLDEVVMGLACLYKKDLGYNTEKLTEISRLFARLTGMPVHQQKPIVADRNWLYKRDHIMRTITQDESIQFPFSPSLVGQAFGVGLGRGVGPVGIKAKLRQLNLELPEAAVAQLVEHVTRAAVEKKSCLSDEEFKALVRKTVA